MLDKSTTALVPEHITETLNLPFSSISLLGKPPHSSIMTMATGKNLTSIPKKVGGPSDLNCPHIFLFSFVPVLKALCLPSSLSKLIHGMSQGRNPMFQHA